MNLLEQEDILSNYAKWSVLTNQNAHFLLLAGLNNCNNLEYEQSLPKSQGLEYRRAGGDMSETFNFFNLFFNDLETVCSLFKLNESAGARGHHFKLRKKDSSYKQNAHFLLLAEL